MNSELPKGWKWDKLGSLMGLVRETFSVNKTKNETLPYVGLEHILPEELKLISHGWSNEVVSNKYKFKKYDILFGKLRPYFRKVIYPKFDGICSTDIWVVRAKEGVDNRFLFYRLASWEIVNMASSASNGTRMPRAQWDFLKNYEIPLPPLSEQQKIGEVLGALDDKIELNYEMNKTLEEMVQAIFKNWFVDFEPFKDNLVYNEEVGKEIPEGWEVVKLEQICDINMGQSPPSSTYNESGEGLPFYQGVRDYGFRYVKPSIYCSSPKKVAEPEDILFSVRAPVGEINMAPEESCIGRGIASLRYKYGPNNFLLYLLKRIQKYWKNIYEGGGTVFGAVTKEDLKTFELVFPGTEIVDRFNAIVKPLDDMIKINEYELDILANIRDLLLPKLLSGEIRVNVEEEIEEKQLEKVNYENQKTLDELVNNE